MSSGFLSAPSPPPRTDAGLYDSPQVCNIVQSDASTNELSEAGVAELNHRTWIRAVQRFCQVVGMVSERPSFQALRPLELFCTVEEWMLLRQSLLHLLPGVLLAFGLPCLSSKFSRLPVGTPWLDGRQAFRSLQSCSSMHRPLQSCLCLSGNQLAAAVVCFT